MAQQIADKRFQKETNLRGWTDEYYKALKMMGWNTINYARQQYSPSATSFSMEKVALDIIRAAAGGAQEFVTIAEKALIATNENGEALSLLENNSASESYATFPDAALHRNGRRQAFDDLDEHRFQESRKDQKSAVLDV
nr:hypothetical protein [Pseudomonas sp. BIGb0427]